MIERVIYTPEAEQDVADAYSWYEAREPGLGEDFLRCVEACVLTLQRHPQLYPVAVEEFRPALVRDSRSRFSTSRPEIASRFMPSFIAHRTLGSGVRDLGSPGDKAPNERSGVDAGRASRFHVWRLRPGATHRGH